MYWLVYVVFVLLCFGACYAHMTDHQRHHVPGILFVSITIFLEGFEYGWIVLFWNQMPEVYIKNAVTLFRILLVLGFWLGVRYGSIKLRDVRGVSDAMRLAGQGYRGIISRVLRANWSFFNRGYQRIRQQHDPDRDP